MGTDAVGPADDSLTGPDLVRLLNAEVCPAGLPVVTARMLADTGTLQRLRQAGAVHYVNMGGRETGWLVTGYDEAAKALSDPRMMGDAPQSRSRRPGTGESDGDLPDEEDLFFLPGEKHARLRRMITRQLTQRRVTALIPRIQGEIDRLLDGLPTAEPVDFLASFARPLPVAVLCGLLDVPEAERRYIHDYAYGWIANAGSATSVVSDTGLALAEYFKTLIARRRTDPGDDLISAMVWSDGPATVEADVLSAVRLLLVAGHHPVTRLLSVGLRTLLQPREHWQRLVDDPTRIEATVEELLRFVTPSSLTSRYAKEETEIGGVTVAPGSGVHCALGAVNRDPSRFPDPDTFDPQRPANPHLAFGLGRKHCLGAPLARTEVRLAFGTLARRFPRLTLVEGEGTRGGGGRMAVVLHPDGDRGRSRPNKFTSKRFN